MGVQRSAAVGGIRVQIDQRRGAVRHRHNVGRVRAMLQSGSDKIRLHIDYSENRFMAVIGGHDQQNVVAVPRVPAPLHR